MEWKRSKDSYSIGSLIVVVAAAVRVRGGWNGLTLDEIWSLNVTSRLSSPWKIFTLHNSNNHYLNSLWLYLAGSHGNWVGYRIPSILFGIGAVVVAGLIGVRRNRTTAWIVMFLFAVSYLSILYSCQARGYAALMFFALLYYDLLERCLQRATWPVILLIALVAILGLASQLIFVNALVAGLIWFSWSIFQSGLPTKKKLSLIILSHGPPIVWLFVLYQCDIRDFEPIEGTEATLWNVYANAIAWLFPPIGAGLWTYLSLALSAFVILAALYLRWKVDRASVLFFVSVIVVAPLSLALLTHSKFLYVRHFLLSTTFALLIVGFWLASLCLAGLRQRVLAVCLLCIYLVANSWPIVSLFTNGQGNYASAIQFIIDHTNGRAITIGGDQDFRIGMVLEFYGRDLLQNKNAGYYLHNHWPPGGPEWLILQKEAYESAVPPTEEFAAGAGYRWKWEKTFPAAPLSSQHWFIYHRVDGDLPAIGR